MLPTAAVSSNDFEVAALGQIFTPQAIVDCMCALVRNRGRVLEPACGDGAFFRHFPGALGIEVDPRHAPPDRIMIFRKPILEICHDETDVIREVGITVVHEIAHHFGIDDERLDELGYA